MPIIDGRDLVRSLEDCNLPFQEWTHEAHVRVAFYYLRRYSVQVVVEKLRIGIKKFNAANDRLGSYHETVTVAMVLAIADCMDGLAECSTFEDFRRLHPEMLVWDPSPLGRYYSRDLLGSKVTRLVYVAPDLRPFKHVLSVGTQPRRREYPLDGPGRTYRRKVFLETAAGSIFRQYNSAKIVNLLLEIDPTLDVAATGEDHVFLVRVTQLQRLRFLVSHSSSFPAALTVVYAVQPGQLEIYPQEGVPAKIREKLRRR